jgi:DnaK suppressor protein
VARKRSTKKSKAAGKAKGKKSRKTAAGKARKTAARKAKKAPAGKAKKAARPAGVRKKPSGEKRRVRRKPPLTKAQLREFRSALLEKRRALVGDMAGIEDQAIGNHRQEVSSDPADQGTDSYEQEFSLGLLESERALLDEINEALARIDEGTYGYCQGTGKPIGLPRLRARPWAKYCIDYARMVEKGLVRPGEKTDLLEEEQDEDEDD